MSFLKALAGETIIYGLGYVLPRIVQFIFGVFYFTRILDQTNYGSMGILYAFIGLVLVIVTLRMETALFRFASDEDHRESSYSTGFFAVLFISLLVLAVLWMNALHWSAWLTTEGQAPYIKYLAVLVALDACAALPFARLRLEQKARTYAYLKIANTLLLIFFTLLFIEGFPILHKMGLSIGDQWLNSAFYLDSIFYANILASGFILAALLLIHRPQISEVSKERFITMFKYALPLIPVSIAGMINMQADQWMIKEWVPSELEVDNLSSAGIYAAAKKLATIMIIFTTAFNYAAEPFFFRNADDEKAPEMYARIAQAYTAVSMIIITGVILFLDFFAHWLGENLRGGVFIVPISILAFYFLGLYYNVSIWYKLKDKTILGAWISLVGVAITIGLSFVLLPSIGIIGSAWAALACFSTMCLICVLLGRRYFPVPYKWVAIGGYLSAIFLVILLINLIPSINIWVDYGWRIAGLLLICVAVYKNELGKNKS